MEVISLCTRGCFSRAANVLCRVATRKVQNEVIAGGGASDVTNLVKLRSVNIFTSKLPSSPWFYEG